MKGFLAVTIMSFRTWWRDRGAVFWGVFFPILLMGLLGLTFGGESTLDFKVSVVTSGPSPMTDGVVEAFKSVSVFDVVEEDEEVALGRLRAGERSLVVVIPEIDAQAEGAAITIYYDQGRSQVSEAGIAIARQILNEFNKRLTGRPDLITLQTAGLTAQRMGMFDFLLPGVIAMTLMQTGLMGVTWVIAGYRERLVLKRVLTTPFHPMAFLSGLVARFTIVNLMQAAIIFLVGTYAFGAKTAGSLLSLGVLAVVGSVAFLAIGFAISTLSKTAEAAGNLGSVVNFPMLFLSGTFWPREMLPDFVQPLVGAMPLTPLVDAMRGVGAMGVPLANYTGGVIYLLAWAAAGFAVAAWKFRWE